MEIWTFKAFFSEFDEDNELYVFFLLTPVWHSTHYAPILNITNFYPLINAISIFW